jgi:asparagine N-glycosylation enzyme membrane subunit Stt3
LLGQERVLLVQLVTSAAASLALACLLLRRSSASMASWPNRFVYLSAVAAAVCDTVFVISFVEHSQKKKKTD